MIKVLKNFLPRPAKTSNSLLKALSYLDILGIFQKDPFGNPMLLKRFIIFIAGWPTFWRIAVANKLKVEGVEYLKELPDRNVFFISNHQTYFADVITFYHIFCNTKWGFGKKLFPIYLFAPRAFVFYVAAKETMKKGLIPKIFSLAGAILVERSWRAEGQNVKRNVDLSAGDNVSKALQEGWVVSFPQGTTSPYAPIRKGTAHIILDNKPIIVPVVINGFRRAFNKTGLKYKRRNTTLTVKFKPPFQVDENSTLEGITKTIEEIIEQSMPEMIAEWNALKEMAKRGE
ncbi:phospholipid/glycerol acyltransferase [Leadbetterella byssophila DSM 17132]|uniref:Phospholipid/glycerol acyltransferase n=1 Tax=Leadbetterella byssophila (strain DSM 17132 / JCM 16389 / KACC 11308 / NBRC 106382 / 4M15) TaxID=649349 RepID=E4RS44_LEAB4|nr:lysophospholipid acyltransferase family protein [Leadbetterella byssophila]ADQ15860.1 phospholipid/glycerol acyltransferase [Leadbetterella byssophila DSM 17132]